MDGVMDDFFYTRDMLKSAFSTRKPPFVKANAIHQIKCQPFFGEYWQKPPSDRITIRRPTAYPRTGQWMG